MFWLISAISTGLTASVNYTPVEVGGRLINKPDTEKPVISPHRKKLRPSKKEQQCSFFFRVEEDRESETFKFYLRIRLNPGFCWKDFTDFVQKK